MAVFRAHLTSAGLLGEVEITTSDGTVNLRGLFAPSRLVRWRSIIQWSLAAAGIVSLFFWHSGLAFWLIGTALVFSFIAYLALWWTATEHTITITPGADTKASTGWSFHMFDVLMLLNWWTMISLLLDIAFTGHRTISFTGPSPSIGSARYVVLARNESDAAALTAVLRGSASFLESLRLRKTALPIHMVNQTSAELFGVLQCPECGSSEHVVMLFAAIGSGIVKAKCNSCDKEFTSVLSREQADNLRKLASIMDKG